MRIKRRLALGLLLFVLLPAYAQTPKNIIVMIGDGMGFNHVEACNNYYGKVREHHTWDTYRVSTYSKEGFYNSDSAYNDFNFVKKRYTDSGAAATALGTGYKTHLGVIGLNENYYNVENLTEYAELKGLSSGVVTTVPFCHATPAGFVAHVSNRGMYHTIASQMLIDSKLDVIIGCGNPFYDDNGIKSQTPKYKYISEQLFNDINTSSGLLTDDSGNKRVVQSSDGDNTPDVWTFISTLDDFKQISEGKNIPKRLFGMPQVFTTVQAGRTGTEFNEGLPDLGMLSTAALNVLSKNKEGFFLMIEGGAIDWASHDSSLVRVIEETNDFNNAVEAVIKWVEKNSSWKETLVIVTADHETGFLTNTSITPEAYNQLADKNATVLKINNALNNNTEFRFHQQDGSYAKCDHTNSLVPLYVKGAGSILFLKRLNKYKKNGLNYDRLSGTEYLDNTDIPKLIFDMIKDNDSK